HAAHAPRRDHGVERRRVRGVLPVWAVYPGLGDSRAMKRFTTIVELLRNCPAVGGDPVLRGIPAYRGTEGLSDVRLAEIRQRRWLTVSELASIYAWKEGGRNRHLRDILGNAKGDA